MAAPACARPNRSPPAAAQSRRPMFSRRPSAPRALALVALVRPAVAQRGRELAPLATELSVARARSAAPPHAAAARGWTGARAARGAGQGLRPRLEAGRAPVAEAPCPRPVARPRADEGERDRSDRAPAPGGRPRDPPPPTRRARKAASREGCRPAAGPGAGTPPAPRTSPGRTRRTGSPRPVGPPPERRPTPRPRQPRCPARSLRPRAQRRGETPPTSPRRRRRTREAS